MEKNILIISSNFTGHGHKSITEALSEQFALFPDVNIHVVDGFSLSGGFGLRVGKLYGSVTRNAKEVWKMIWDISMKKPSLLVELTELTVRDSFLKLLKQVNPDVIITVHPSFNGSIINILEEYNIKIPFISIIADLVSISPLWADPRADYTLCPTMESKYKCLEFGVSESRLKVTGFPVRSRFCEHISQQPVNRDYDNSRPLECFIMSGGEGSGNMTSIAKILLNHFNCNIKIVTGRNAYLKKKLEITLQDKYQDRVQILGFTENIQELMLTSDIAFTRGSPNVMMEAVMCNVPLVITGALPGQEEGNPAYALKYNLGVVCKDLRKLRGVVNELLADNAHKLNQIKKSQREYRNPDAAKNIVNFIMSLDKPSDICFPQVPSPLERLARAKSLIPDLTPRFRSIVKPNVWVPKTMIPRMHSQFRKFIKHKPVIKRKKHG